MWIMMRRRTFVPFLFFVLILTVKCELVEEDWFVRPEALPPPRVFSRTTIAVEELHTPGYIIADLVVQVALVAVKTWASIFDGDYEKCAGSHFNPLVTETANNYQVGLQLVNKLKRSFLQISKLAYDKMTILNREFELMLPDIEKLRPYCIDARNPVHRMTLEVLMIILPTVTEMASFVNVMITPFLSDKYVEKLQITYNGVYYVNYVVQLLEAPITELANLPERECDGDERPEKLWRYPKAIGRYMENYFLPQVQLIKLQMSDSKTKGHPEHKQKILELIKTIEATSSEMKKLINTKFQTCKAEARRTDTLLTQLPAALGRLLSASFASRPIRQLLGDNLDEDYGDDSDDDVNPHSPSDLMTMVAHLVEGPNFNKNAMKQESIVPVVVTNEELFLRFEITLNSKLSTRMGAISHLVREAQHLVYELAKVDEQLRNPWCPTEPASKSGEFDGLSDGCLAMPLGRSRWY